mgnify:CR=1 FL=1
MIRGTTPKLTFKLGIRPSRFQALYITAKQGGNVVFERSLSGMNASDSQSTVDFRLTQEETLRMSDKSPVYLQARGVLTDGNVVASDRLQASVSGILKEGII